MFVQKMIQVTALNSTDAKLAQMVVETPKKPVSLPKAPWEK